jgi:glycerophosphoryl diester phosphodiesterase
MDHKLSIITHRGLDPDITDFPAESTFAAFKAHLKRGYGIEFDFHFTSDGVPIVIHDDTLERFSNGRDKRILKNTKAAEIRTLHQGGRIATLTEIVSLIASHPRTTTSALHYKGNMQNEENSNLLLDTLAGLDSSRFIIFDLKPDTARYLKTKRPDLHLAASVAHPYDVKRHGSTVHDTLLSLGDLVLYRDLYDWVWLDEWDLNDADGKTKKLYTKEVFDQLREIGMKIALVTPELHATSPRLIGGETHKDASDMNTLTKRIKEILDLSPDAICTDHPDLTKNLVKRHTRIAVQNIHQFGGILGTAFHGYVRNFIANRHVTHLYFDEFSLRNDSLRQIRKLYSARELGLDKVKLVFDAETLNRECDVLVNFSSDTTQFTQAVKDFKGLKVFHMMDYFWTEPLSTKYARFLEYGIDYVMSYGNSDIHDSYFKEYAPDYIGKVIPVPFGYAPRFRSIVPFEERKDRCVAIGSVRPLRFDKVDPINFAEEVAFFSGEEWFHKFRRMLVEAKGSLSDVMDSMLPEFPQYRDYDYDMVAKFNEYKMFISDESLFRFPSAKAFEGPVTGCVMVCSDHQCFKDLGFKDGVNCVMHREFDIEGAHAKIKTILTNPGRLAQISETGKRFVEEHYSHETIAMKLHKIIEDIYEEKINSNIADYCNGVWRTPLWEMSDYPRVLGGGTWNCLVYTYAGFVYYLFMEAKMLISRAFRKIIRTLNKK